MRRPLSRTTAVPALAAAALLLGACTTGMASAPQAAHTSPPSNDPAQIAQRDTAALLSALALPPGATKSASEPSGTPSALNTPAEQAGGRTAVTSTGWWVVDSAAGTALSWIQEHNSAGSTVNSMTYGMSTGPGYQAVTFMKPGTAVLASRQVVVTAAQLSAGRTVVRADAQDLYRPAKSSAEIVPAATSIVVTVTRRLIPNAPNPSPFTVKVTDAAKIAEITALINSLPVEPDVVYSCPMDTGGGFDMDFVNAVGNVSLATVDVRAMECGGVAITVGGRIQPSLDPRVVTGQGALSGRIGSILGVTL